MLEVLLSRLKSLAIAVIVFGFGVVALARGGDTARMVMVLVAMYLAAFYLGRVVRLAVYRQWAREHPGQGMPAGAWVLVTENVLSTLGMLAYANLAARLVRHSMQFAWWTIPGLLLCAGMMGYVFTQFYQRRAEARTSTNTPS